MHRTRTVLALVAAALLWPAAAQAQSLERSIERWAEMIAANAERIAAKIERKANKLAIDIEREFEAEFDRDYSSRRRSDRWDDRQRRDLQNQGTRIDTTIAFSTNGIVDLTSMRGDIIVTGWDRREARIQARVERGIMDFELSSSRVTIEERGGQNRSRNTDTQYELTVPRGVRVIARTNSGDISITGSGGEVEANTTSGDISIAGVAGRVEASALSGEITLSQIKGNVDASAVTGSITAPGYERRIWSGRPAASCSTGISTGRSMTAMWIWASTSGRVIQRSTPGRSRASTSEETTSQRSFAGAIV